MNRPDAIEALVLATSTNETKSKGRVRKVTFEIPADGPNPFEGMGGERIHIVCVRLNNDETPAETEEPKERRRFNSLPAASQIAMACQAELYREYIRYRYVAVWVQTEADADRWVKNFLGVESKREVVPGSPAFAAWTEHYGSYEVWLKYERAA